MKGRCIQQGPFMELSVAFKGIEMKLWEAKHNLKMLRIKGKRGYRIYV